MFLDLLDQKLLRKNLIKFCICDIELGLSIHVERRIGSFKVVHDPKVDVTIDDSLVKFLLVII